MLLADAGAAATGPHGSDAGRRRGDGDLGGARGLVNRTAYEGLRDEILDQLRAALPVDGVVLGLHGAMVAQGYDDCEGDLLARVRDIVGPDVLVAAELDPHSHLTDKRVAAADILASFLEFPHTDFYERGEHVVDLALRALRARSGR